MHAFRALLDRTLGDVTDVEAALHEFGRQFAAEIAHSPERSAVMRLLIAEAAHFPALLAQTAKAGSAQQALADRLAELAGRGLLDVADPMEAAEFLGLLVTGRVNNRSWYGAVQFADAEIEALAASGVRMFLRVYGSR
ncbi:TetR/AcrR family transcriptional regulator C-terminal domain-containing protein [Dactylosporangium sp. CA-233914]|uniref:TetR/AcrR family transcriptional regulator C-terminal domain-containing protein n=1 Tax=Dactylosporangium sp. CA-233914 TaxID=3239934 RepID=UPI003D904CD3